MKMNFLRNFRLCIGSNTLWMNTVESSPMSGRLSTFFNKEQGDILNRHQLQQMELVLFIISTQ